jgi:hypothetical protein
MPLADLVGASKAAIIYDCCLGFSALNIKSGTIQ